MRTILRQESSIESIHFIWEFDKITLNCLINQRFFQVFAMFSIFSLFSNFDSFNSSQDIDFFNSSLSCSDSKIRQFNDVTSFLRNLEHCQELYRYRRTKLLEYMLWILNDFAWKWYKKQTHFNFLSRFNMILTKAFLSQKQRELKAIAQKRAKRKARKIAKRIELKIIKTAKSTSKLQNIDIFDSTLIFDRFEFDLYREVASFLQYLEQRQHQYRKSDLLNLLLKCLCDLASEWFNFQSKFTSLKRFSKILAKAFSFAKIFSRRASSSSSNFQLCTLVAISKSTKNASSQQVVRMICKFCKQNFNFNKKLYEHIRSHETSKSVKNSYFSINAINLVCEIEKRSFVSQKSHESFTRSQNSIFEFAVTFEAIILLKRSTFQSFALETASKSTKKSTTCRHCKQTFNFKKMFRQHKREQHAKRLVVNFHLSIDAVKSACESMKISTINSSFFVSFVVQSNTLFLFASFDIFNSNRSHQNLEKRRFNEIVIFIQHFQHCQQLYCESKVLEWVKVILYDFVDIWFENQSNFIFLHDFSIALTKTFSATSENLLSNTKTILQIDSSKATCRHCDEIFNFKNSLRKHKSEQHSKKHVKNFRLENNAIKLLCAIEKMSVVINALVSSELRVSIATLK